MTFAAVFSDIRRRRRIAMRLFGDLAGVSPSYIHDIEQGRVIPSLEKLNAITSVLRQVAVEQGAADPDADGRALARAREFTIYVERLEIEPQLASVFVALRALDANDLATLEDPVISAVRFVSALDSQQKHGLAELLVRLFARLEDLEVSKRHDVAARLVHQLETDLDEIEEAAPAVGSGNDDKQTKSTSPPENDLSVA
jgi:transcriptional regulator with XRE-family HTH domain